MTSGRGTAPRDAIRSAHEVIQLRVTTRLDGADLVVPVHRIRGGPGPCLGLISALHGSEWSSIEIIRRVVRALRDVQLAGTVLAVPVANPVAFERLTRMTPDESDEPDLNRVWPGGTTWTSEQIAMTLDREVLQQCSHLIDFHTGPWGSSLTAVGYGLDLPDRTVVRTSLEMAVAFGYPAVRALRIMSAFPGPRSIGGYAGAVLGMPNIGPNLGGAGFAPEVEDGWLESNVRGVLNVMSYLGMLEGRPKLPPRFFHFESRGHRVVPRHAGLLEPKVGPDALLGTVEKGQLLGRVISPYTFDVLEDLIAPVSGVLFGVARPYPVRPGDWAFFVADGVDTASRWIDARATVTETADAIEGDRVAA